MTPADGVQMLTEVGLYRSDGKVSYQGREHHPLLTHLTPHMFRVLLSYHQRIGSTLLYPPHQLFSSLYQSDLSLSN